jgi:RimJ/RimL family protein N-acetyltransferase
MTIIETERLLLRHIVSDDIWQLLRIYNKPENMRFISNGKYDWTMKELKEKYERTNKNYELGTGIFTIEHKENHKVIGEAGLFNSFEDHSKLELGYIIDSVFWNRGFGEETCKGLIEYGFDSLKVKTIISRMYRKNTASVKLSKKCGMKLIDNGITEKGDEFLVFEIRK